MAADAVVQRDGRAVVFVDQGRRSRSRCPSRPGKKIGDLTTITGDVKSGDKVVLKPADNLASGAQVKLAK